MGMVEVNGRRIEVPDGSNIAVINDLLYVNGVKWDAGNPLTGIVKIKIEGSLVSLQTDRSVEVTGDVSDLKAGGSVNCENVSGNVHAGGSVNCGKVGGSVKAGGSLNYG